LKTIQRKDFLEVGSAVKVHGTKGELKFNLTQSFTLKDWAFLEFRGKPVPFYIDYTKAEFADEIIIKLSGIDTIEQANNLIGKLLLLPSKQVKNVKNTDDWTLAGYLMIDQKQGVLGTIVGVIENTYQSLALLNFNERELMVPLVEEIVLEINDKKKEVLVDLPDGLLTLN
jgi:16S rRNA processing protein RimM